MRPLPVGYGIYRFWQWRKHKAQIRQIFTELKGSPVSDVGIYRKAVQRQMSSYFSGKIYEIGEHAYGWAKPFNANLDIEFTTMQSNEQTYITQYNSDHMDYDVVSSQNLTMADFHGLTEVMIIEKSEIPYFEKLNQSSIFKLCLWEYNNLAPTEEISPSGVS